MEEIEKNIELLMYQVQIKAAELNLKAQELKTVIFRKQVGHISELEFKGEVSALMHEIGMIECQRQVWKQYEQVLMPDIEANGNNS